MVVCSRGYYFTGRSKNESAEARIKHIGDIFCTVGCLESRQNCFEMLQERLQCIGRFALAVGSSQRLKLFG